MRDLIVIGGGEHARVVIDAALSRPESWRVLGFLDRNACQETVSRFNTKRLGTGDDDASAVIERYSSAQFIIAIGSIRDPSVRERIAERFSSAGAAWATVVHRDATVSPTATLGPGSVVCARAVVNTGARVGAHCVINTSAVVEHDVTLGDFCQIAPAAALGGGARVGAKSYLGLGSRVRDHVQIGCRVVVGMGAVVVTQVPDHDEVIGVPAKSRRGAKETT